MTREGCGQLLETSITPSTAHHQKFPFMHGSRAPRPERDRHLQELLRTRDSRRLSAFRAMSSSEETGTPCPRATHAPPPLVV
jgi:hypothetical protein